MSAYQEATEADDFGNYELLTTFPKADVYYIKVAIQGLAEKNVDKPLSVGFSLSVSPPDKSTYRLFFFPAGSPGYDSRRDLDHLYQSRDRFVRF